MSIEDKDPYYVLEEEINKEEDSSPLNYAAYNLEEQISTEIPDKDKRERNISFLIMLKIMFNPVEGWKTLRRSKISIENLQGGCFYPVLALLSISCFADYFYLVNINLSELVTKAVITFVAFFFGYFCVPVILSWTYPKEESKKFESNFGKKYILVALTTLALFSILTNILPMVWPILIFLPIWTLYIMFKGIRFFHFPEKLEMKFFVFSGITVIGLPLLFDWIINLILPY